MMDIMIINATGIIDNNVASLSANITSTETGMVTAKASMIAIACHGSMPSNMDFV